MDGVVQLLETFPWWGWLALAGLLLIGEVLAPSTLLLWPALSALLTGFAALWPFHPHWSYEIIQFALGTIVFTFAGPKLLRAAGLQKTDADNAAHLNDPLHRLVGARGEVVSVSAQGDLRINVGSGAWTAVLAEPAVRLAPGDVVEVIGVENGRPVVTSAS